MTGAGPQTGSARVGAEPHQGGGSDRGWGRDLRLRWGRDSGSGWVLRGAWLRSRRGRGLGFQTVVYQSAPAARSRTRPSLPAAGPGEVAPGGGAVAAAAGARLERISDPRLPSLPSFTPAVLRLRIPKPRFPGPKTPSPGPSHMDPSWLSSSYPGSHGAPAPGPGFLFPSGTEL